MLTGTFGREIMRGVLCGLAGVAPRSVIQNLVTLLVWLLTRLPGEGRIWARDVLFGVGFGETRSHTHTLTDTHLQNDFVQCKADNETKEKFLTALSQLSAVPVFSRFSKSELGEEVQREA